MGEFCDMISTLGKQKSKAMKLVSARDRSIMLMVLVQSVIRLPNSVSHLEESMAGHVSVKGVY
jgi:hypothetical protein